MWSIGPKSTPMMQGLRMGKYIHEVVNHAEAYVRGQVRTNGLENFWFIVEEEFEGDWGLMLR